MKNTKKIICACLAVLMLLCFASCGKKGENAASFIINSTSESGSGKISDTVKVNIPVALIDEKYQNDIDAFCSEYGFEKGKTNSDGTVTVKKDALSYDLLLTQIGMQTIGKIYAVAEDGDFPYVKGIKSYDDKNFAAVSVLVNRAKYSSSKDPALMRLTIAKSCMVYQAFAGIEEPKFTLTIIDNKTKETIEEKTYTPSDIG